jgi:hypothetical protein
MLSGESLITADDSRTKIKELRGESPTAEA